MEGQLLLLFLRLPQGGGPAWGTEPTLAGAPPTALPFTLGWTRWGPASARGDRNEPLAVARSPRLQTTRDTV